MGIVAGNIGMEKKTLFLLFIFVNYFLKEKVNLGV